MIRVEPAIQEEIEQLHLIERKSMESLAEEYEFSIHMISRIIKNYHKEAKKSKEREKELANIKKISKLTERNQELEKEVEFLKKAAAFFAKESK